jgi:hypothetical protein
MFFSGFRRSSCDSPDEALTADPGRRAFLLRVGSAVFAAGGLFSLGVRDDGRTDDSYGGSEYGNE